MAKLALIPREQWTEREAWLFKVYSTARDCVTGSMVQLYTDLGISNDEFYYLLNSDVEFSNAVKCGLTDSRIHRLLELESSLIMLALGRSVTETKTTVKDDGSTEETTTVRQIQPNLSALQILLEKYEGSSWTVTEKVLVDLDNASQEIPYEMLDKAQLKQLANYKAGGKK